MVQGSAHAHRICVLVFEYLLCYDSVIRWVRFAFGKAQGESFSYPSWVQWGGTMGYFDFGIWLGVSFIPSLLSYTLIESFVFYS